MRDDPKLTSAIALEAIAPLSRLIFQAMFATYQRHPEWIDEKFRNHPWQSQGFHSKLLAKLTAELRSERDAEALIRKAVKLLQTFLTPTFFVSSEFFELMVEIRDLLHLTPTIDTNGLPVANNSEASVNSPTSSRSLEQLAVRLGVNLPEAVSVGMAASYANFADKNSGIAILLLDAENLSLDEATEDFLKQVCQYDLQIKIAFANWQRMGKKDTELHGRHYELVHVPAGKDSADVKMATVGSSIFVHYPNAKEVLVCSSDGVMTHLCTTLQTHGLAVYLVRKHGKTLTVLNTQTGKTQTYLVGSVAAEMSLGQCIESLKQLIKAEQQRTGKQWIKLSRISALFQEQYHTALSQVAIAHLPGKKVRDIFCDRPADFAVHQPSADESEFYVNLFDRPDVTPAESTSVPVVTEAKKNGAATATPSSLSPIFKSREELEKALNETVTAMQTNSPGTSISTGTLGAEFKQLYGQNPSDAIKQLGFGSNFSKFLLSCSSFTVKKTATGYEVAIAQPAAPFNSLADLEQVLINLLTQLTAKYSGGFVPIANLASEFQVQYGVPITQVMKALNISGKFPNFLNSANAFKVKKAGKVYQVALSKAG